MQLQSIQKCLKYCLKTDYSNLQGHAIVTIVGKDRGLVKVMLLNDYEPIGKEGDTSWIEPDKIVEKIN